MMRSFRKQSGFTLVELMVIIFISVMMTVLTLVNFSGARGQYKAEQTARQLVSDLRRVQNMALAGKVAMSGVARGYGVYIESASRYILFYNTDFSVVYDTASIDMQVVNLNSVALNSISKNIFFVPPDPTVYIDGVSPASLSVTVSSNGLSKIVLVNTTGNIDIN